MQTQGTKALVAENLMLRKQLIIISRKYKRAPNLSFWDRLSFAICCMFNKIIAQKTPPKYLSSDNDPLFLFHPWQANLRILEIEEIKTLPYIPMSHPFIERLIKSIRHEMLDKTLFWTEIGLQHQLNFYQAYYNNNRSHQSLNDATPNQKYENSKPKIVDLTKYQWKSYCNHLFYLPIAA